MIQPIRTAPLLVLIALLVAGCQSSSVKKQNDKIYSRRLQTHVPLTIFSTPAPDDTRQFHLLLVNDGQDIESMQLDEILDSMYMAKAIGPLLLVGIHAGDRSANYGFTDFPDEDGRGKRADLYAKFVTDELIPFIRKKAGTRGFRQTTITGWSQGALSAFDVAWHHPQQIDQVGCFSGSFWWRDRKPTDSLYSDSLSRIVHREIRRSRRKPKLNYWFYTGGNEETGDRDQDGITDMEDDTRDLIAILQQKKLPGADSIVHVHKATGQHNPRYWKRHFVPFLAWMERNYQR